MNNNLEYLILKKLIQKALLNELYNKGLVDFINTSNIITKLDEDISKLKNTHKKYKNITVKVPL